MCLLFDPSAAITSPSEDNDELIFFASSNRCPVAPLSFTRSEPAKSTKLRQLSIVWSVRLLWPVMFKMNTEWLRDERSLHWVDAVARRFLAFLIKCEICDWLLTSCDDKLVTLMCLAFDVDKTSSFLLPVSSHKSRNSSQYISRYEASSLYSQPFSFAISIVLIK